MLGYLFIYLFITLKQIIRTLSTSIERLLYTNIYIQRQRGREMSIQKFKTLAMYNFVWQKFLISLEIFDNEAHCIYHAVNNNNDNKDTVFTYSFSGSGVLLEH